MVGREYWSRRLQRHRCIWSETSLELTQVLVVADLGHQVVVEPHGSVGLAKHVLVGGETRIKWSHISPILVSVSIVKDKSLFVIEAFLDELGRILRLQQVAGHLVDAVVATGDVVVRQGMVQFRVVDEVDAAG